MKISLARNIIVLILSGAILASCAKTKPQKANRPTIAVTTSYLECAARDVAGDAFDFVRLVPPGMCPGHFDIAPSVIKDLKNCPLLLRFDFQKSIDPKLRPLMSKRLIISGITAPEGLCVPESYRLILRDTRKALCDVFPGRKAEFDVSLNRALLSLSALEKECQARIKEAALRGEEVVASGHQAVFAKWLGLNVVATYSGASASTPRELEKVIDKGRSSRVRFIIANLQEGNQQSDALAAHLGAKVVVFSNFPNMTPQQDTFAALIRTNINNLLNANTESHE